MASEITAAPDRPGQADQGAATPAPTARGGHHDWHSADYVRRWVEDNEARAEERRRQFDLLADYVPHAPGAAISVLDVGAGWGPVTKRVLERFPNARATLLDYSEEMFAEARASLAPLADRVRYVRADLSRAGGVAAALEAAGGPFDAVVTASFTHNLHDDDRLRALYRELRDAAAPGCGLLNMDNMGAGAPFMQPVWHRARVERLRRRRLAETGQRLTPEEAEAELQAERRRRFGLGGPQAGAGPGPGADAARRAGRRGPGRSVFDHLTWLREAGFDAVDCFWRQDQRTLVGAYVAP
jgi:SAM-dependent methyltransferase